MRGPVILWFGPRMLNWPSPLRSVANLRTRVNLRLLARLCVWARGALDQIENMGQRVTARRRTSTYLYIFLNYFYAKKIRRQKFTWIFRYFVFLDWAWVVGVGLISMGPALIAECCTQCDGYVLLEWPKNTRLVSAPGGTWCYLVPGTWYLVLPERVSALPPTMQFSYVLPGQPRKHAPGARTY